MGCFAYIALLCSTTLALNTSIYEDNNTPSITLQTFMTRIIEVYNPRSLIIALDPDNLSNYNAWFISIYDLVIPIYSVNMRNVAKFNGKYDRKYNEVITFEESKIYILILDKLFEMEMFLFKLQSIYFWRQRDRILVLIPQDFKANLVRSLRRLSFLCWNKKILNVSFVLVGNTITTAIYNPFTNNHTINITFSTNINIFPDKLRNLFGYNINISMFPNILDAIPNGNSFKGRDGLMASTVEQILNATFTYIGPSDGADYGEKNSEGMRMSGVFGDVANGRTEIAFNSRYLKGEFENLLEATYPHGRDDLTGLVPVIKPSEIKDFGRNFSTQIWLVLIATQIILFCLICILTTTTEHDINPVAVIEVLFRLMLGQSAQYHEGVTSIRLVLLSITCITFFFEIAYVSQLASILAVPRKPNQINTLEQLADSDLKIYTLPRFKRMLNSTLKPSVKEKLIEKLLTFQETEQIDELNEHKFIGAICKEHIAIYVVQQKNNYEDNGMFYRIMDEKPMPSIVCYGVRYGSLLLEKLNIIMNRLTAAGIPNQWRKLTLQEMSIKGNMYQKMESTNQSTLTLKNLIHVFYCLSAGWGLGLAAFVIEVIWQKVTFEINI